MPGLDPGIQSCGTSIENGNSSRSAATDRGVDRRIKSGDDKFL